MATYLVRNSRRISCQVCGDHHDWLTERSEDAVCDTPVAFSREVATEHAIAHAQGSQDVVKTPDNMLVVLDSSARQLPHAKGPSRLAQISLVERSM